ncbi:MAG: molecular chaperone TorD family protein [Bacteroidota bacterium]
MDSLDFTRLTAQAGCYKVLVSLYSEPKIGIHDKKKIYDSLIKHTGFLKPKALELAKKLRKTASILSIEDLNSEYIRLFNNSDSVPAYPCCDKYFTGPEGATGSLSRITEFYEEAGFTIDAMNDKPGHIVTELKFIDFLLDKITGHLKKDNAAMVNQYGDLRCRFIHEHMIRWVPEFTRSILYNSKSPYYLQLAILLRTLLITCSGEEEVIPD